MKSLCLLLVLSSCSVFIKGSDAPKTAKGFQYSISFSEPGWVFKKDNRSDYVWENQKDGRILLSNSFCDEFQEQPLERLAEKTFRTIDNFKSSVSKYTTFQDREAYQIEGKGTVDGVKVSLRLLNTRRNNCYFDFLAISPAGTDSSEKVFADFLKEVAFR